MTWRLKKGVLLGIVSLTWILGPSALADVRAFACEPEWAALLQELAGDKATIYTATTAQQDPHHVEARPSFIAKARRADIIVCSGADLEGGWLPLLLRTSGNNKIQLSQAGYFEAAMQVHRLEIPERLDRALGDIHAAGNPHVHLDPRRLSVIADALSKRLLEIDPEYASYYRQRLADFSQRWQAAIDRWSQRAAPLRGKTAVVHHRDWSYLFDWLGIKEVGQLEPKPGIPPTASHLATLKQQLAATPPDFILYTPHQSAKAANWLAEHSGGRAIMLPYTIGGDTAAQDLFRLFDITLDRLLQTP